MSSYLARVLGTQYEPGSLAETIAQGIAQSWRDVQAMPRFEDQVFRGLVEKEELTIDEAKARMKACTHPGPLWDDEDDDLDGNLHAWCRRCGFSFVCRYDPHFSLADCQEHAQKHWPAAVDEIAANYVRTN